MFKIIIITLILLTAKSGYSQDSIYTNDFIYFWETFRDNYAYFDTKQTDWNKVKDIYLPLAGKVNNKSEFIQLLEKAIYELYDNHTHLLTNLSSSYRLSPSGLDIWAEWENNKFIVKEVRLGSGADLCGIKPGMEIIALNDVPIKEAAAKITGLAVGIPDKEIMDWAVRTLLAGNYENKRILKVKYKDKELTFEPDKDKDPYSYFKYESTVDHRMLENNIGYIRINNSLGDEGTIGAFDSAMTALLNSNAMIIDLRETPGGGSSVVARGIMSRFISEPMPYQMHQVPAEERLTGVKRGWIEYVYPRGLMYDKPLVILVNHWTGSMGEGIAIGFNAIRKGTVIGTKMAGLVGAKYDFRLPNTGIGVSYSAEKLFHINGTQREKFIPDVQVEIKDTSGDQILDAGIKFTEENINK